MQYSIQVSACAACALYGLSMIILFTSSSLHHAAKSEKGVTEMLRRLDHVAIYCFIAGSYTPYCAISVEGALGVRVLAVVWSMGLAGAYQKIFLKVRFISDSSDFGNQVIFVKHSFPLAGQLLQRISRWAGQASLFTSPSATAYRRQRCRCFSGASSLQNQCKLAIESDETCPNRTAFPLPRCTKPDCRPAAHIYTAVSDRGCAAGGACALRGSSGSSRNLCVPS